MDEMTAFTRQRLLSLEHGICAWDIRYLTIPIQSFFLTIDIDIGDFDCYDSEETGLNIFISTCSTVMNFGKGPSSILRARPAILSLFHLNT